MTEAYLTPAGEGSSEYVEKKSRFLARVFAVSSEDEARALLEAVKREHYDARHNCWCYTLRGGAKRYSDDGEPQGTAGQPMLEVFSREGITDCVCIVTRYFGGILLGTGGLARAYTKGAKDALLAAGVSVERLWDRILVPCSYAQFERVRQETEKHGGVIEDTDYGADVMLTVLTPEGKTAGYLEALTELSAGSIEGEKLDQVFRGVPVRLPERS